MLKTGASQTGEKWRDHWRTPPNIIERIEAVLGPDWFDPCPADPTFDGLSIPWPNTGVYVNPPFSQYAKFFEYGRTQPWPQIWMANTDNSTKLYQEMMRHCTIALLWRVKKESRIGFIDPRTNRKSRENRSAQTLFYFGCSGIYKFREEFSNCGIFVRTERESR